MSSWRSRSALPTSRRRYGADASESRVKMTLEGIPQGVVALDAGWHVTYANSAAFRLLRRQSQELLGRNLQATYPEFIDSWFEAAYGGAGVRRS